MSYQKENPAMQKTYDRAIIGKHVNSPPKSPDNHKCSRNDEDCKVPIDEESKPKLVMVPTKPSTVSIESGAVFPCVRDSESISTAFSCPVGMNNTNVNDQVVPFVMPATMEPGHTIVTQHHLNNIQ